MNLPQPHCRHVEEGKLFLIGDRCVKMIDQPLPNRFIEFAVIPRRGDRRAVYGVSRQQDYDLVACFPHLARYRQDCIFGPWPYPAESIPSQVSDNAVTGLRPVQDNSKRLPHILVHAQDLLESFGYQASR